MTILKTAARETTKGLNAQILTGYSLRATRENKLVWCVLLVHRLKRGGGGYNKDFGSVSQKDLTRSLVPSIAEAAQGLNQKRCPFNTVFR